MMKFVKKMTSTADVKYIFFIGKRSSSRLSKRLKAIPPRSPPYDRINWSISVNFGRRPQFNITVSIKRTGKKDNVRGQYWDNQDTECALDINKLGHV